MTKMKTLTKVLLGASVFSLMAGTNAFAAGTAAGTSVKNTFSLDYEVSGVGQPTISTCQTGDAGCTTETSTNFTVDRLIDLTVTAPSDETVAPGQADQELIFTVTNTGNDTQAYDLVLVDETGDQFDTTGQVVTVYVDGNDDGILQTDGTDGPGVVYTAGDDTADVPADGTLFVVVQGDIPGTTTDGDQSDITLIADTLEPSTGTSPGTPVVADTGGNTLTGAAENVLGDAAGVSDLVNEGDHSATGAFVVASADLTASKAVSVHTEDGTDCTNIPGTSGTDPLSIPGSCVEYVISATNDAAATENATAITIADTLPPELIFQAAVASGFTTAPTGSSTPTLGDDCDTTTCLVSYSGMTLAPGTTGTVTIRALVK